MAGSNVSAMKIALGALAVIVGILIIVWGDFARWVIGGFFIVWGVLTLLNK